MSAATPSAGLERFVAAQAADGTYAAALSELRAGRKRGHWIWFVLPQFAGLGQSAMSRRYAISSLAQAREYLAHPVLGPRLRECSEALLAHASSGAVGILGELDAVKLRSSMTLFARVAPADEPIFRQVLLAFFDGDPDPLSERLIDAAEAR